LGIGRFCDYGWREFERCENGKGKLGEIIV